MSNSVRNDKTKFWREMEVFGGAAAVSLMEAATPTFQKRPHLSLPLESAQPKSKVNQFPHF